MALSSSLNLRLGIDVSNLSKELAKVERSLSRFGGQMESIGSKMTQSFTLPIVGLGTASLKSFADLEKLNKGLVAIMGSSELATSELVRLREVAKLPGLGFKEAVQGSINLQAVGLSADEARNTLMGFGKALAATGKGKVELEAIQYQLTQMISKNKILAEDYKVIQSNLPLMAKGMELAFGTNNIEAIRETGISAKEFTLQLSSALEKLPQTQNVSGGLANSMENLSDNLFIAAADFGNTINSTLGLEKVFENISNKVKSLVDGFKALNPTTQGYIIKIGLFIATLGPAIFIIGKFATGIGALVGTVRRLKDGIGSIQDAMKNLAKNPQILIVTALLAALGAIALYVYDNWQAFKDNFANIWINISNSAKRGINSILEGVNKIQKALGIKLFDESSLIPYVEEQRIVAKQFKTIGETVDSLKGKLGSLFLNPKASNNKTDGVVSTTDGNNDSPTGGGLSSDNVDKKLFAFKEFKTLNDLQKATDELNKSVITDVEPKIRESLGLKEGKLSLLSMKNAANDVLALGEKLKSNPPNMAKPFSDADAAAIKLEEKVYRLSNSFENLNEGLQNIIDGTLNDLAIGFGDQLANAISGAGFSLSSLITPLADALGQFGKLAIQTGLTAAGIKLALKPPINPALAIAGGVALLALSKLVKSRIPALAEGGLATGPTMAMVGDNKNAKVDPEVIAPLSKLKGMLNNTGGLPYILSTRVSGSDLIVIMEKAQNINSRIR